MAERFGQYGKNRFLEMIPGMITWGTFVLAVLGSFVLPSAAIVFIILFDVYWTLRVFYFVLHVTVAYREYRRVEVVDWQAKLKEVDRPDEVWHAILLPTYKESLSILQEALRALKASKYRSDRFLVVVGGEKGDHENFAKYQERLEAEFNDSFALLDFTVHPSGLEGEIPGKGSNMKWMAGKLKEIIDARQIPYADVIVSAFDVDTLAHPQYFARLTWLFRTVPDPLHSSYQPITLFSNNIWYATAPVRIAAFGTVFWLMSELVRPERMWTFSSHSMPWQMLVDVGYWEPDLVSEDSRIFLQAFLRYEGRYRVTSIFLPVHMDAVTGTSYYNSLVALYRQQRRWAWGVEHLPYMLTKFREHPLIKSRVKRRYIFNHLEGMYTWATAPFMIFILGYLPFWIASDSPAALVANSPFTLEWIMRFANLGVFVTATLSLLLLPKRPEKLGRFNWLVMIGQWVLLPVTFVLFGAIPAIDAQTRFMLGYYLGFNVTKKERLK